MKKVIFSLALFNLLFSTAVLGQVSKGGRPKSFTMGQQLTTLSVAPEIAFNGVDEQALLQEDARNSENGTPYRFGVPHNVNYTLSNSGKWDVLQNGDRIWRFTIRSRGAYSINLIFDQYRLPAGAELFIYNADRSMVIGAFTDENNQPDGKFGVQPVKGEAVTLEYYEPAGVSGQGALSISEVIHAYRNLFNEAYGYGNSLSCHININCALGSSWQSQKRAVALIVAGGGLCSGALVNNTALDGKPYLLTADHCFSGSVSTWVYVFNYESPNCTNIEGPTNQSVSGSTLKARNSDSDFLLVELNSLPPTSYNVHYAGWSKATTTPTSVAGIHHPAGDIKKISTDASAPTSNSWSGSVLNHWQINGWDNGTTEGGSSGSPLFDNNGRIIGQLHGGTTPACPGTGKTSLYGKFDASWSTGATSSERLSDWLDPANTGVTTLNGADQSTLLTYCASTATSTGGGLISDVSFGTIANTSGTICALYSDFTSTTTNVTPGASIPLSVTTGNCGTNNTRFVKVFIDWNGDFDFNDFGELVGTSSAITSTTPYTTNVSVPGSAVVGSSIRMRVVCTDAGTASGVSACGSYTTGETEDYTLNVTVGTAYTLPVSGNTNITTCSGVLYDNGGANSNYPSYCNGSVTINPSIAGNKVSLNFTSFSIEDCCDMLYIYNGTNTSAPLIGVYTTSSPGTVYATGASGALTVLFVSDGTVEYSGFQANIACVSSLPQADLIPQIQSATPTSVASGAQISVSCDISNQGGTSAASSTIGYYLSADNAWDAADVYLGNSPGGTLAVGTSSTKTATLTIPVGTAIGSYYILYYADYLNSVTEGNETNNVTSYAITIVAPSVDLIIQTPSVTPTSFIVGTTVNLSSTILNQGSTSSNSSNVGYYLSTNTTWDASDTYLGVTSGGALANGASALRTGTITVPGTVTPGSYYLLFFADNISQIGETDETNNVASIAVTVANSYLVPASGSINVTTCSGTLYDNGGTNNYTNYNAGQITISPATAGNYIRLNFTSFLLESCCDYVYIYDGTSTGAPLIGTYNYNNSPGIVYATNASGALTVRFTTDGSVVYSGFEAAISCVTSVPLADLTIQTPTVTPLTVAQGGSLSLTSYIQNIGGVNVSSSYIGYYLSSNNTWDASDTYLNYSYGGSLNAGISSYRSGSVSLPGATTPGNYYILFYADYQGSVTEGDETNNVSAIAITVVTATIDFIIQSPSNTPSTVPSGGNVSVSCSVANQGSALSSYSYLGYYLSTDAVYDASDTYLGYYYVSSVNPSGSVSTNYSVTIPASTPVGNYYILYYADYTNGSSETNETNNVNSSIITVVAPTVDLIIQTPALSPSSIPAGGSVGVWGYIANLGNSTASSSYVGYYLSTDAVYDVSDVFLTYSYGSTLASSGSSYRSATVTIPAATAVGNYYILYFADYQGSVSETNETNNVSNVPISVVAPTIDLIIQTPYLGSSSVPAGSSVAVSDYIYNQGNSTASSSNVGYYLSTNNTWDASDVYLTYSYGSTLASASSSYRSATLTIPAGTTVGTYYILYYADYQNSVSETNETNNVSSMPISIVAPTIDLVIQSPYLGSSNVPAGSTVSVSNYINNIGNTTSPGSNVGYYLSTDNSWDASDTYLGYASGGSLAAASSSYRSTTITIPVATTAGSYYILYFADYAAGVTETNETNNVTGMPITIITPTIDLVNQSNFLNVSTIPAGSAVTATGYVYNLGNSTAPGSYLGYYLSTDNIWDASDVLLTSTSLGTIASSSYSYRSTSVTIPVVTSPGNYYLLFFADYQASVTETNETNNTVAISLTVTSPVIDLIIQSQSLSTSSTFAGNSINASCYIYNQGSSTSSSSNVGYYLSTNTTWDAADTYLGNVVGSGLLAASSSYRYATLNIPGSVTPGTYYVLFYADYSSQVPESNETNNVSYQSITISSGYVVPFTGTSSITTCSGSVYDHAGTSNYSNGANGTLTINPATAGNYVRLSFVSFQLESCCDYLYIYDGTSTSSPLIGYYNSSNSPGIVYATSASGALTLMFTTDGSVVYSGFEATISCVTSVPLPDLTVSSLSSSPLTMPQGTITYPSSYINNIGGSVATSSNVGYYLSTNNTWDASDVYLGVTTGTSLNAGSSSSRSGSVTIPAATTPGSYYLLFYADYQNSVSESNETNNVGALAITVTSATVDLIIQSPNASPSTVAYGGNVSVSCYVANQGSVAATSSSVGYYLSTNTSWDAADVYLGYSAGSTLTASNSSYRSNTLTIPVATATGSYYILYFADYAGSVTEGNETNNVNSIPISVIAPSIDLIIQTPSLGTTALTAGATVLANCYVYNQGSTTAASHYTGYYLSTNTTYDASDVYLGNSSLSSISASTSSYTSNYLTIPSGTAVGNYYILYYADYSGSVSETNETNNVNYVAITISAVTVDLVVQSPSLSSSSVSSGNTIAAYCYIANTGNSAASYSYAGYYLSTNTTYDASDVYLNYTYTGSLSAGSYEYENTSVTIPSSTITGTYYILFIADYYYNVTEGNENNNVSSVAISVIGASPADLTILTPHIGSTSIAPGNYLNTDCFIYNQSGSQAPVSYIGFYLSTDATWSASDVALGNSYVTTISSYSTEYNYETILIPSNTIPANNYYIIFYADYNNGVPETNENNNTYAVPISIISTGIDDASDVTSGISVFPNPTTGQFKVSITRPVASCKITVLNSLGETLMNRELPLLTGKIEEDFQLMNVASGCYTLKIEMGDNVWFKKLSIEK